MKKFAKKAIGVACCVALLGCAACGKDNGGDEPSYEVTASQWTAAFAEECFQNFSVSSVSEMQQMMTQTTEYQREGENARLLSTMGTQTVDMVRYKTGETVKYYQKNTTSGLYEEDAQSYTEMSFLGFEKMYILFTTAIKDKYESAVYDETALTYTVTVDGYQTSYTIDGEDEVTQITIDDGTYILKFLDGELKTVQVTMTETSSDGQMSIVSTVTYALSFGTGTVANPVQE